VRVRARVCVCVRLYLQLLSSFIVYSFNFSSFFAYILTKCYMYNEKFLSDKLLSKQSCWSLLDLGPYAFYLFCVLCFICAVKRMFLSITSSDTG